MKYREQEKKISRRPNYSFALPSPWGRYSPKQWMNCLTILPHTYNPSTASWGEFDISTQFDI